MCYNCGCQLPDDPMGKGRIAEGGASLTEKDFQKMADEWGMDLETVKKNTLELLQKTLHSQGK